jgi:hypothetical protein
VKTIAGQCGAFDGTHPFMRDEGRLHWAAILQGAHKAIFPSRTPSLSIFSACATRWARSSSRTGLREGNGSDTPGFGFLQPDAAIHLLDAFNYGEDAFV